ncbi:hypothetical protein C4578_02280 [Candidatus Microgenomates bacterium]|nr:MAG: hypothetical protein C4578_02280 [Candidatus Microgenomates bacterium]
MYFYQTKEKQLSVPSNGRVRGTREGKDTFCGFLKPLDVLLPSPDPIRFPLFSQRTRRIGGFFVGLDKKNSICYYYLPHKHFLRKQKVFFCAESFKKKTRRNPISNCELGHRKPFFSINGCWRGENEKKVLSDVFIFSLWGGESQRGKRMRFVG